MTGKDKERGGKPDKPSKAIELGKRINQKTNERAMQNNIDYIAMHTDAGADLKKSNATKGGMIITVFFIIISGLIFLVIPVENEVIGSLYGFEIVDRWAMYALTIVVLVAQSIYKIRKVHRSIDSRESD